MNIRVNTPLATSVTMAIAVFQSWLWTGSAFAQPQAPLYEECRLDSIYPSGAQRGTTVKVEFKGHGSGLTGPLQIVIDGAGGITARELKSINGSTVEANLEISPDAPLGRRWLRVLNERSGLTNFAQFVVGSLAEVVEVEPNDDAKKAQSVQTPVVINGRINPQADQDVYRFQGHAGQKLIAAVAAHALDVHGQYKNAGIADCNLELLNAAGRTLATAEDTIGFDPIIDVTLPDDGEYLIRVQLLNYGGFPEAVYRLTLGDVGHPVAAYPAGYQRGSDPQIELIGPNVTAGTILNPSRLPTPWAASLNVGRDSGSPATQNARFDPAYPLHYVTRQDVLSSGLDVPLLVGNLPELLEAEPNDELGTATELAWPMTANGRLLSATDVDWYRVTLKAGQKVWFETTAHRFIRSPIDTLIQVYDNTGKMLAESDDESFDPGYECYHDYRTTDSKVMFASPAAGAYFVRVSDQNGVSGPNAIYRLTVTEALPDFRVTHFPDAVPIWGPGSTACVMARVDRFADCQDDIEVSVIGLPDGWTAQSARSLGRTPQRYYNNYQNKVFLAITAPADAAIGTSIPFRIVGRLCSNPAGAEQAPAGESGPLTERASLPLTLFYTSDTGFFRASPVSRVAVAKPQGPWLEAITRECTLAPGGTTNLEVRVHNAGELKEMPVVVSLPTNGVACGLTTPRNLPIAGGIVSVPLSLPADMPVGTFHITVAQTWRNDIRIGMPGPCTSSIKLTVAPAK